MRYPRILTCSSARPRYCSCPSGPQHTRSPVRYIRVPGAPAPPKGHATNRDAVKPARRTYPHATPRPATYNSPTTPAGTGRNHPSSTNNAAPATGEPIGGGRRPPRPGPTHPPSTNNPAPGTAEPIGGAPEPGASGALIDANTVVSVGP